MTIFAEHLEGDDVRLGSRLIVAPVAGIFRPSGRPEEPATGCDAAPSVVHRGEVIGFVDGPGRRVDVASCFSGTFRGLLAESGERVRPGQPLAWLDDAVLGTDRDPGDAPP